MEASVLLPGGEVHGGRCQLLRALELKVDCRCHRDGELAGLARRICGWHDNIEGPWLQLVLVLHSVHGDKGCLCHDHVLVVRNVSNGTVSLEHIVPHHVVDPAAFLPLLATQPPDSDAKLSRHMRGQDKLRVLLPHGVQVTTPRSILIPLPLQRDAVDLGKGDELHWRAADNRYVECAHFVGLCGGWADHVRLVWLDSHKSRARAHRGGSRLEENLRIIIDCQRTAEAILRLLRPRKGEAKVLVVLILHGHGIRAHH
mmetsp:Transcript_20282/g.56243  ORF Transcript_20282/g.56243 Transcript_20282/m.56243 type:complete len:257 (-) Transcript_20282:469-1239(-)